MVGHGRFQEETRIFNFVVSPRKFSMTLWRRGVISAFGPNFRGLSHSAGFRLGINDNLCSFGLMTHAWVSSSFQGQVSCQGEKGWEVNKDLSKVTRLRCG